MDTLTTLDTAKNSGFPGQCAPHQSLFSQRQLSWIETHVIEAVAWTVPRLRSGGICLWPAIPGYHVSLTRPGTPARRARIRAGARTQTATM